MINQLVSAIEAVLAMLVTAEFPAVEDPSFEKVLLVMPSQVPGMLEGPEHLSHSCLKSSGCCLLRLLLLPFSSLLSMLVDTYPAIGAL